VGEKSALRPLVEIRGNSVPEGTEQEKTRSKRKGREEGGKSLLFAKTLLSLPLLKGGIASQQVPRKKERTETDQTRRDAR